MDDCPLGMVEKVPESLRAPGANVVQAFVSDRQKNETATSDGILTKIVTGGQGVGSRRWVAAGG